MLCHIQYSTSPNGCYRPHGAHGASLATQVASTLLTVSLYVRMICGEPSLQAEATVAFTRRARAIPDVIRGPYPSTRRRTRFLPHPIILSSRSPDSHANKKLAGSISRTSHLQLFRHRATYMTSRVCGMPGSQYIASALSPPALARDHRLVKYYTLAFLLSLSLITFVACTTRTSHQPPVYLVTAHLYITRLDDVDIT